MEEDEETKRLNERRRVREERRKKQEEDDAKEEQERKAREEERKARKDNRNKERNEREAQQKKELEEYIKRTEDERKQRREEREKRRIEEERIAKEDEEKRKRQQEERERKRREEDEEKKKRIKELEESRKRVLKELEDDENNSQVESILSLKKKRQAARQKIESILATIDPTNNQYSIVTSSSSSSSPTDASATTTTNTITNTAGTKILKLLLTEELKEEVIDLVSSGFRSLIDYMSHPSSLATMVEFLVDIQVGSMVFQSKFELHNGTASLELKNSLARIQASYEILKGGIPILAKIITDPVNSSILDILFGMISNPPPISTTNMHIFVDLVVSFMSRKPELLVYICNNKDTILPSFMQHLSNSETVDLLLKMAEVEMTQFSDSPSSGSSSSGSAASSFFSLFTGSSSSSSNNSSTSLSNTKEKPHWTSELTPYLILRINEICNFENVIMDQLDLEVDNITRLMFELVKKYPKSKVAHHLCGQSFSNSVLRNGFKLALSLPYTSPISSSMLSLICTLVDSSIAMTQLSSSSTTTPDLPSVINLLFKQIVIVDVLDDDGQTTTRELSPIKAISEILTIKQENQIPLEIFSIVRLKVLHLIGSLVKANIPKLDREIWESGILKKCIDIFFQYETNNVIHCIIEGFLTPLIQRCLGSDDEEFMCHLLKDCSFISRVVNILSGGVIGVVDNNNNNGNGNGNVSTISSGTNSLSSGSGSLSGSSSGGVASRLSALFVNSSKDNNNEIEQPSQKSEPIIGAPAPAMGSLSRGGGKKIRRKVSFFSNPNEEDGGADDNSGGSGEVKLAIGDLSMFQSPVTTTTSTNGNIVETQSNTETNINTNTIVDSEKKFSASLTMSPVSTTTATISSSSSTSSSLKNSGNSIINKSSTTSSSSSSPTTSSLSKKEKELTKEQEKLKQKEKEKEILDMLKSKQLTAEQEKELKAQRKQEKKERKQKREEKKLAKRLKEKEKENGKSKLKNSSGSVSTSSSSSSSKLKTSSSSPTSSPNITSSNNSSSSPSPSSSPSSSPPSILSTTTSTTTTTTSSTTTTTIATSTTNSNILLSDQASSDISKLSLNDTNSIQSTTDTSIENIESSIEEQSVIVVYHEGEEEKAINTESCNNNNNNNININNIVDDVKPVSSTTTTTTTPLSPPKKRVNHNVGHIISLCIEITHIVNKSKGQLLRDIVDECCLFQGQWDEVVVPKLKQEISYRASKPIGTVSMRKGRKGGPPTPFANVESFVNTANGVIIPPTETTSKFFF